MKRRIKIHNESYYMRNSIGENANHSSSDGSFSALMPSEADTPKWVKFVMKIVEEKRRKNHEIRKPSNPAFKYPQ